VVLLSGIVEIARSDYYSGKQRVNFGWALSHILYPSFPGNEQYLDGKDALEL
jgi:hypothetical protein